MPQVNNLTNKTTSRKAIKIPKIVSPTGNMPWKKASAQEPIAVIASEGEPKLIIGLIVSIKLLFCHDAAAAFNFHISFMKFNGTKSVHVLAFGV